MKGKRYLKATFYSNDRSRQATSPVLVEMAFLGRRKGRREWSIKRFQRCTRYVSMIFLLIGLIFSPLHAKGTSPIGGRFQLIQLGEYRRDQFLIDTETGRIWNSICVVTGSPDPKKASSECQGTLAWEEMYVENLHTLKAGPSPKQPN